MRMQWAIGGGIAAAFAIWAMISFSVQIAVQGVVARDAIDKATSWGAYMAGRVPDLEALVESGTPTATQREIIREIRQLGDIFRFKLFDRQGRLVLLSDDSAIARPSGIAVEADPEPLQVARSRQPLVSVNDGTAKPDRPDLYAEAYVPLISGDGSVSGVVEVYVDQTATQAYFHDSFRTFGLILTVLCLVVVAVPGAAYWFQRRAAERSRRSVEFLASYDPLTGLLNRREFVNRAQRMAAAGGMTAICYIDVDRFKQVNDSFGHAAGDALLARIASVLRGNCRSEDLLARFGGDEFVLAFHGVSAKVAAQRVRRILKDCAGEVEHEGGTVSGTVSIGLTITEGDQSLDEHLSNADAALYNAKAAGRNTYAVYGVEMGRQLRERHALEARLREVTQSGGFDIHYQPLIDAATRRVVGYEALLRMQHADGSQVPPSDFIPLAEELGLIEEIGTWVIRTATAEMAGVLDDQIVAINLSPAQFRSGDLVGIVRDALAASGLPPAALELEITESLLLEDSPMIEMQIDALKELGVAIAMDDFGTGFSSLSYLWKYGFDRIKVDRSFVSALGANSRRSHEIIETVIMLGERLGMKVTAEGVETSEQSTILSDLGCDVLQGYYFGRPARFSAQIAPARPGDETEDAGPDSVGAA